MRHILFALMIASLVLSGCFFFGEEEMNVTENETLPPPLPPTPIPVFSITSPMSGEVLLVDGETGDATLTLSTQNLLLRAPGTATKKVGEGYFALTVDGVSQETFSNKVYVVTGLELGEHTVEVELLHNDGTPYIPQITQEVSFTLEQEEPEVYVPQQYTVKVKDFEYEPASITVKVSDSITFVNEGNFPRSATCFIGGKQKFDTGIIASGKSATITLTEEMECEYYATTHALMKGTIVVESNE
ncbi:hypothetical protein KKB44_02835 [Candidatus Micrarchaeota archaeon]|nr:hypothetical protein [Candidatus Micrarchaeota archaeon]